MNDKKGAGKLGTYAVILLLMVIIVIIIAAMADNREQSFQNQIEETTQANMTKQNEIVALEAENYNLIREVEELKKSVDEYNASSEVTQILCDAWTLYESDKRQEAADKLSEIDESSVPESITPLYRAVKAAISLTTNN